ncbi:hypothetical protein AB0J80_34985 [Actinoplanes sp. NPDC049548]|uniref:hypothetical protein n=1 Tax=Actinoplanes sp. NPDC049548 TaxID=3155152 RepID=UPI00342125BD
MTRSRRAGLSRDEVRRQPLYARMLGLQYLAPSGFLCFVFLEGAVALGILLALAELVSWWGVLVLPVTVAVMVKLNDVVAGALTRPLVRADRAQFAGAQAAMTSLTGSRFTAGGPLSGFPAGESGPGAETVRLPPSVIAQPGPAPSLRPASVQRFPDAGPGPTVSPRFEPPASPALGGRFDPPASPRLGGRVDPPASPRLGGRVDPPASPRLGGRVDPPASPGLGGRSDSPASPAPGRRPDFPARPAVGRRSDSQASPAASLGSDFAASPVAGRPGDVQANPATGLPVGAEAGQTTEPRPWWAGGDDDAHPDTGRFLGDVNGPRTTPQHPASLDDQHQRARQSAARRYE